MVIRNGFEFLTLGGVFLGVENNSKNFGNKKNIMLFSKRGIAKSGSSDRRCFKMAPNGWIDFKLSMEGSFGR